MECTLVNLAMVLKKVFERLNAAENADLVLAIGNTGCGKSTMLTSIVFGPGHLEEVTKKVPTPMKRKDPKTKEYVEEIKYVSRTVIEQSPEIQAQDIFKVGHSNAISETFIPQFSFDNKSRLMYGDIAGLLDSGGDFMQFINSFMNHVIFKKSRTVRFLVTLSPAQIKNDRGAGSRVLFEQVRGVCNKNLLLMVNSILPVITKVKPKQDENVDLDDLRNTLKEQLQ